MRTKDFLFNYAVQYLVLFIIVAIGFLIGCSKGNEPEDKRDSFGIYLLEDQSITWEDMKSKDIETLKLKEWITGDKIDFYDYSSHVIYLNTDYKTLFAVTHEDNTPFVVVANKKPCYYGRFSPPMDTTQPHVLIKPLESCNDMVMLEFNPPYRKDIRVNEAVKQALIESNKYKGGFTGSIINGPNLVRSHSDTLNAYFYIRVLNLEKEVLYVVKPSRIKIKAGNNYYVSRAVFYNDKNVYSEANYYPSYVYNLLDVSTVTKNMYHNSVLFSALMENIEGMISWNSFFPPKELPKGNYNCYIECYGMMGGNKENRAIYGGRAWNGYLRTNTINLDYDSLKITVRNYNVVLE